MRHSLAVAGVKRPLVSVITATWQRHDLLMRCIRSVRQQTYPNIQHVVVSDGLDPDLSELLAGFGIPLLELDHHHSDWGATPRQMGSLAARGEYIAYLDDDNVYEPEHIANLVAALECQPEALCAFSQMQMPNGGVLGDGEVELMHIDTSMVLHRRSLWDVANWRPAGYTADWDLFSRWRDAGIGWVFVPEVTVRYRPEDA